MKETIVQHNKDLLTLFDRIDGLMSGKERVLVAIDGDCAAGKTTLAALLAQVYDCNIVHMDHFFLRPEQRTEERLAEVGGNIDYERFGVEVLEKLKSAVSFSYRPFNCAVQNFDEPILMETKQLTIVEGSYSHHPTFSQAYDLRVFLSIPEEVQLKRILKRNGASMYEKFRDVWIPMEKQYAEVFGVRDGSDLVFDGLENL